MSEEDKRSPARDRGVRALHTAGSTQEMPVVPSLPKVFPMAWPTKASDSVSRSTREAELLAVEVHQHSSGVSHVTTAVPTGPVDDVAEVVMEGADVVGCKSDLVASPTVAEKVIVLPNNTPTPSSVPNVKLPQMRML